MGEVDMDALRIMGRAETIAKKLVADLKAGVIQRIDHETIVEACGETPNLTDTERALLINTVTRRVVEMV